MRDVGKSLLWLWRRDQHLSARQTWVVFAALQMLAVFALTTVNSHTGTAIGGGLAFILAAVLLFPGWIVAVALAQRLQEVSDSMLLALLVVTVAVNAACMWLVQFLRSRRVPHGL
jgi:uncharacterized membrane protein YhaH (DUF805 family)